MMGIIYIQVRFSSYSQAACIELCNTTSGLTFYLLRVSPVCGFLLPSDNRSFCLSSDPCLPGSDDRDTAPWLCVLSACFRCLTCCLTFCLTFPVQKRTFVFDRRTEVSFTEVEPRCRMFILSDNSSSVSPLTPPSFFLFFFLSQFLFDCSRRHTAYCLNLFHTLFCSV